MPFSVLSKRRWPFSRQSLKDSQQMKMPHTKVMCFFKKDIREKYLTAFIEKVVGDWVKTVSLWQTSCLSVLSNIWAECHTDASKENVAMSDFFLLARRDHVPVCVNVQSWCNLVWQVTVMLYSSKNTQQCLNNTFWKGYMRICGRLHL